jgi:hypothetical protein
MSLVMVRHPKEIDPMTHDLILAFAFLAMLVAPCIVAMRHGSEEGE